MTGDVIKLNYPAMEEMAQQCKAASERLTSTANLASQISSQMQNGALVGDAGDAFTHALTSALVPAVNKLSEKFKEIDGDIRQAISDMQSQDKAAGSQF